METTWSRIVSLAGLAAIAVLLWRAMAGTLAQGAARAATGTSVVDSARIPAVVMLLAVGDVNLGRAVGQEILRGDTLYPFAAVRDTFQAYDIVFANLESTLSDQNGETQSPKNNLVFTGPPAGASALQRGAVTVVSTANNHALDYGLRGERETLSYLDGAAIAHAGSAADGAQLFAPALVSRKGIRFAFFACTDIMNATDARWRKYVAPADTGMLLPRVRAIRDSVDFIVVSYHGGEEYSDHPSRRTMEFAHSVVDGGADLFLGHHPHVTYGIDVRDGRYIVPSLGNFVFHQPARYWTQWSFGFAACIRKDTLGTRVSSFHAIPVAAGAQPRFVPDGPDAEKMLTRIRVWSSREVAEHMPW